MNSVVHNSVSKLRGLATALILLMLSSPAVARKESNEGKAASKKDADAATPAPDGPVDYPAATRKLEESYHQTVSPETLYQLGALAQAQGNTLDAQDFMRRYLADTLTDANAPNRPDAEKIVAQPRPASGEVQVLSDQFGYILVDGRLVGAMPLSLPLLVPVGKHVISLELRDRTMKGRVKVLEGRGMEVRFSRESGAVVVTLPPAVIVLSEYVGSAVPAELQRRLQQTTDQLIIKARLALYSKDVALAHSPKLADCLNTVGCQSKLATENEVDYVLTQHIERSGQPGNETFSLRLNLIDAEAGDSAASIESTCPGCTPDKLNDKLIEGLRGLMKKGLGRPRGTLDINTDPPGAEVHFGTRLLGETPYARALFVGSYDILLDKAEYQQERVQVEVREGKRSKLTVSLTSKEPAPAPLIVPPAVVTRRARPIWRIVVGSLILGAGLTLTTFGASGVAIDNQCVKDPPAPSTSCRDLYTTLPIGGGLLGAGLAVTIGGALIIAIPGKIN